MPPDVTGGILEMFGYLNPSLAQDIALELELLMEDLETLDLNNSVPTPPTGRHIVPPVDRENGDF